MSTKRKAKKAKRRAKRSAEYLPDGLVIHGAFMRRADAERKAASRSGAFIVRKFTRWGRGPMSTRYCVFTHDKSTSFNF